MNAFVKDVMTTNVVWVGQDPAFAISRRHVLPGSRSCAGAVTGVN